MKKKLLIMLTGACTVMALTGCGKKAPEPAAEEVSAENTAFEIQESEETEMHQEESTPVEESIEGIVKLTVGENEYTDAVYEFAAATQEM